MPLSLCFVYRSTCHVRSYRIRSFAYLLLVPALPTCHSLFRMSCLSTTRATRYRHHVFLFLSKLSLVELCISCHHRRLLETCSLCLFRLSSFIRRLPLLSLVQSYPRPGLAKSTQPPPGHLTHLICQRHIMISLTCPLRRHSSLSPVLAPSPHPSSSTPDSKLRTHAQPQQQEPFPPRDIKINIPSTPHQ